MLSFPFGNDSSAKLRFRCDVGQCRFRLFDNGTSPPTLIDKSPNANGDWTYTVQAAGVPSLGFSLMLEATAASMDGKDVPIWLKVSSGGGRDVSPEDATGVTHNGKMGWLLGKAASGVADDFFMALLPK